MRAQVGDWVVAESSSVGTPHREGQVVGLRHPDGSPPFEVRWLADDTTTLYFPGPDARVLPQGEHSSHPRRTP